MRVVLVFAGLVTAISGFGQEPRTLEDCETAFIKNNLSLLAQQYNVSQADADIAQAKIWDLPQVSFQTNLYNPDAHKAFDLSKANSLSVQQLLYLGGKKKYEVAYARSNREQALLEFDQLLAELKARLNETYYTLHYEEKKLIDINTQLTYMAGLLEAFKVQTAKGNTSLKEQVRLQSMVVQLNNDKIGIVNAILQQQQLLKTFTGWQENIHTAITDSEDSILLAKRPLIPLETIKQQALEHNAGYRYSLKNIEASKINVNWQRSQNVPDLTLGGEWDQLGGAFRNEVNLTVGIPIPLWKRNKGNVTKAQYQVKESQANSDMKKLDLETSVELAYQTWENQYDQYAAVKAEDLQNLQTVHTGMMANFRKGNVTLIDFTDFMDSYRQTILQLYEMKKQLMIAAQELNRLTQSKIF
ncbi:TolC family protein [Niabella sp. CC-SYL272]|uniref:TolC family protein n=1 Tax=Niabella agricola TaxID=2891571 RepID=UPI001F1F97CF|nr:TolC family protein [Niabella agricola]MCF3110297.1 TolC family protein [Niabella agricola]